MGIIPKSKKSRAWVKQEKEIDEEGVPGVSGSGNGYRKGDNKGQSFLIEAKTTSRARRVLSSAEFAICERNAAQEDRLPAMQIQLLDQKKLAVLRWEDFVALVEEAGWKM